MKIIKYALIENGEVAYEGTENELRIKLNKPSLSLSNYCGVNYRVDGRYRVKKVGVVDTKITKNRKPKVTKEEKIMDYLKSHLEKYGNTVFAKSNPETYLDLLKKDGIKCKARKVADTGGKRKTYYYIFEVVNGTKQGCKSV